MDVAIHSRIFAPCQPEGPYLVLVSALPCDQRLHPRPDGQSCAVATTLAEARRKCRELASHLCASVERHGDRITDVQFE